MTPFCASLATTRADIFFLNLSRAGLTADATVFPFQALTSNKHLFGIKHLLIAGAKMTDEAANAFVTHLERLAKHNKLALKTLDISCTGCYDKPVGGLSQFQAPLTSLHLGRTVFKSGKIDSLLTIVSRSEHLRELGPAPARAARRAHLGSLEERPDRGLCAGPVAVRGFSGL